DDRAPARRAGPVDAAGIHTRERRLPHRGHGPGGQRVCRCPGPHRPHDLAGLHAGGDPRGRPRHAGGGAAHPNRRRHRRPRPGGGRASGAGAHPQHDRPPHAQGTRPISGRGLSETRDATMEPLLVASDIGGTFTDTVTIEADGTIRRYKAPTVPDDPAAGVLATLEFAAGDADAELSDLLGRVSLFAHGTTVATNAMLERKTAIVGLIQTRGFGDTLSIMRGFKSLGLDEDQVKNFRSMVKQELVVPKRLTREVSERVDYRGRVVQPLDEEDARRAIRELREEGVEVFAVSLLWAFKNPAHERRIGELIAEEDAEALFTLSSELLPRLG